MFTLRSLRIKAMQRLFAIFTQQKADGKPPYSLLLSPRERMKIGNGLQENTRMMHHLHATFLQLMTSWAAIEKEHADKMIESLPPTPLNNDPLLTELKAHPSFVNIITQYPSLFDVEHIERWYHDYAPPCA